MEGRGPVWRQDSCWNVILQRFRATLVKAGIKVMFESLKTGFEHWKKKGRKKAREGGKEERRKGVRREERGEEGGREEWSDAAYVGQVHRQHPVGLK